MNQSFDYGGSFGAGNGEIYENEKPRERLQGQVGNVMEIREDVDVDEQEQDEEEKNEQDEVINNAFANVGQGLTGTYKTMMLQYWQEVINNIEREDIDFKTHQLPLARIKKVMKSDENVKMISAEAPILFAKGCDIFITELTMRAWIHAEENKRRTLQKSDISAALKKSDMFDFLIDIVPRDKEKHVSHSNGYNNGYNSGDYNGRFYGATAEANLAATAAAIASSNATSIDVNSGNANGNVSAAMRGNSNANTHENAEKADKFEQYDMNYEF